jgi:hypothetical protein
MSDPFPSGSASDNAAFEAALADRTGILLVWSIDGTKTHRNLSILRMTSWQLNDGHRGSKHLATKSVSKDKQEAVTRHYRAQKLLVGQWDPRSRVAWHQNNGEIVVWDKYELVMMTHKQQVQTRFYTHEKAEILNIIAMRTEDSILRSLDFSRADGSTPCLVFLTSTEASLNPTYGRNDLLMDTGWMLILGRQLSEWAGVPFINRL